MTETAATERFSPPLSQNCLSLHYLLPRASQSHPLSSSLLETVASCCSLTGSYSEKDVRPQLFKPSVLTCICTLGKIFKKEKGYFFEQVFSKSLCPVSLSAHALNHSVFRLHSWHVDVWTAQLASRRHPRLLAEVGRDNKIDRVGADPVMSG